MGETPARIRVSGALSVACAFDARARATTCISGVSPSAVLRVLGDVDPR
jgi:hypothetical protein